MFLMMTHIAPHSANSYDPLQAPRENVEKFKSSIDNENRRKYAGNIINLIKFYTIMQRCICWRLKNFTLTYC